MQNWYYFVLSEDYLLFWSVFIFYVLDHPRNQEDIPHLKHRTEGQLVLPVYNISLSKWDFVNSSLLTLTFVVYGIRTTTSKQQCPRRRKRRALRWKTLPSSLRTYLTVIVNHLNRSPSSPRQRRRLKGAFPYPRSGTLTFLALRYPHRGLLYRRTIWSEPQHGGIPTHSVQPVIYTEPKVSPWTSDGLLFLYLLHYQKTYNVRNLYSVNCYWCYGLSFHLSNDIQTRIYSASMLPLMISISFNVRPLSALYVSIFLLRVR